MAELKTRKNDASVEDFLDSVSDETKRADSFKVLEMMERITGEPPRMWGTSMVGFGSYHYKYQSGREGDWFLTGFAPRKQALTLYIMGGFEREPNLMKALGRYKTGKACLYIRKLEEVDLDILEQLIEGSVAYVGKHSSGC